MKQNILHLNKTTGLLVKFLKERHELLLLVNSHWEIKMMVIILTYLIDVKSVTNRSFRSYRYH